MVNSFGKIKKKKVFHVFSYFAMYLTFDSNISSHFWVSFYLSPLYLPKFQEFCYSFLPIFPALNSFVPFFPSFLSLFSLLILSPTLSSKTFPHVFFHFLFHLSLSRSFPSPTLNLFLLFLILFHFIFVNFYFCFSHFLNPFLFCCPFVSSLLFHHSTLFLSSSFFHSPPSFII